MDTVATRSILLVDDHAVVRRGLRAVLEDEMADVEVHETGTARECIEHLRNNATDLVILDIGLPDRNGLDALKSIHSEWPALPVLILSMFDEGQYGVRMIKAGAAGYLTKASAPEKFVAAVKRILAGGRYISPDLADRLADNLSGHYDAEPYEVLSDREYQVFLMIASGKRVSEIADELCLSVKTVSTHRAHVLKKINMKNNSELTHYAFSKGLA
jgi:DNA-binding NarL/FixJ family response regulator